MNKIIKLLLILVSIPLLFLGSKTMFDPNSVIENFGLSVNNSNGLNTVRGVIGGLLLSTAFMNLMGVFTKQTVWLLASAALMAIVLIGRFAGLAFDGFSSEAIGPIVIEIVIIVLALIGHKVIRKE